MYCSLLSSIMFTVYVWIKMQNNVPLTVNYVSPWQWEHASVNFSCLYLCLCVCVCVCVYTYIYIYIYNFMWRQKKKEMEALEVCQQCTDYKRGMLVLELFDLKMFMECNYTESGMPGCRWLVTGFSVQRPGLEPTAITCDLTSCNFGPIHHAMLILSFWCATHCCTLFFLSSLSYGSCFFVINTCWEVTFWLLL